ncbi:Hpt domain-containing protein [Limnohabitans sp.]|jgi:HPt (histidine-containing phosphotransfer) domain-containing protein|uniref:Hpt domain-containing protein n=1 Tax=Limnohabitans sp. TaxID=1907725 RepID=UPI0037C083C3
MTETSAPIYLSVERAIEFIGDANGVLSLLNTLHQTLGEDLPRIAALLEQDDMHGVNRVLHQLKGFTPVFCVDSLVELVVIVEQMSKHAEISEVRAAYSQLAPQLEALRNEVASHLVSHPQA